MNRLKAFFDFYINSSLHVALAVVSLSVVTYLNLDVQVIWQRLAFVFFGTVTGYNFVKYAGIAKLHHRSLAKGLKVIQIVSLLIFVLFIISGFFVEPLVLVWAGFFGLFTLLYALPVFSRRRNLRTVSGVKIFIIAWVWAGVTVVLPIAGKYALFSNEVVLEFLQRFFLILVWILPFEIRDLKYDLQQLGTLPQRIGVTNTKILGTLILLIVVGMEFVQGNHSTTSVVALVFTVMLTLIMVWKAKERQSRYYASFWVEALPVAWLMLLVLLGMG